MQNFYMGITNNVADFSILYILNQILVFPSNFKENILMSNRKEKIHLQRNILQKIL